MHVYTVTIIIFLWYVQKLKASALQFCQDSQFPVKPVSAPTLYAAYETPCKADARTRVHFPCNLKIDGHLYMYIIDHNSGYLNPAYILERSLFLIVQLGEE